ncbi:transcriptional regulator [Bacteroides fragilis]
MLSMRETTLNGKLNGTRGLDLDTLKSIITHFEDLSAEWLLRGEGEMLREKREDSSLRHIEQNSVTEDSFIYKIYQDQLNLCKEKDDENKTLIKQNAVLEERIRQLEADNESLRSQSGADRITDTFSDLPLVDYEEDYPPVERPSSSKHPLAGKA